MNIVFFTPILKQSAIAGMSFVIIDQLIKLKHNVTIIRTEESTLYHLPAYSFENNIDWQDEINVTGISKKADILIYQMGDYYHYHAGCLQWFYRLPGILLLHDYFLGNLFSRFACVNLLEAKEIVRKWYGCEIAENYFTYSTAEELIEFTQERAPMIEWFAAHGLGVITHSDWNIQRILNSCPGPIEILPLPFYKTISPLSFKKVTTNKMILLTIGHINFNKRPKSIITALGNNSFLRKHFSYRLAGDITKEFAKELQLLAKRLKVNLKILGRISDETLTEEIKQADILSCLRWPILEAASASTIEAMLSTKPILVTEAGFYRDLPAECAIKISIEDEIQNIQTALESLYHDSEKRQLLGENAYYYAKETFSSVNYAIALIQFIQKTLVAKSMIIARQSLADRLISWQHKKWG